MNTKIITVFLLALLFNISLSSCEETNLKKINGEKMTQNETGKIKNPYYSRTDTNKLNVSDEEWKKVLPEDLYQISRKKATERPYTGKYWNSTGLGTYYCAACGNLLFRSDAKFSSTCGWPSFFEQSNPNSIVFERDESHGMIRTEALCGRCGGHLGHLFDDGPKPTGKRYCMNSIALDFVSDEEKALAESPNNIDTLVVGGGCFWCIEAVFDNINGVLSTKSGYSGGKIENPTYEQVCTGTTNHAEVVRIVYDKTKTSLYEIFQVFFTVHDPTTLNKQGADVGTQYRSAIFYKSDYQKETAEKIIKELNERKVFDSEIVTKIEPLKVFYPAEDYHDKYYSNNKTQPYCRMVIRPKLEKLEKYFKEKLKK